MPEISRFFGIVIQMYREKEARHHRPHFHAIYGNDLAVYALDPIELLAGNIPTRQRRFVEAWAEFHEESQLEAITRRRTI
ncbi:MAG TPA: DUF4160 domain-containing protein [Candidatus Kapabacteria bacterium]|nr:DUF4160 domain-containing protein [Candidatus Kapabacteria bacterium]